MKVLTKDEILDSLRDMWVFSPMLINIFVINEKSVIDLYKKIKLPPYSEIYEHEVSKALFDLSFSKSIVGVLGYSIYLEDSKDGQTNIDSDVIDAVIGLRDKGKYSF